MLATLQYYLVFMLAGVALKTEDNLFCCLCFLVKDRLSLTTVSGLFPVVTTLTLGEKGSLAGLVLGNLVGGVFLALSSAQSLTCLGHVYLD